MIRTLSMLLLAVVAPGLLALTLAWFFRRLKRIENDFWEESRKAGFQSSRANEE